MATFRQERKSSLTQQGILRSWLPSLKHPRFGGVSNRIWAVIYEVSLIFLVNRVGFWKRLQRYPRVK